MFNFIQYTQQGSFRLLFVLLLAWTLIWKGIAIWKAARKGDKIWYIVMLVLNTVGILEILYIYVFSKRKNATTDVSSTPAAPQQ